MHKPKVLAFDLDGTLSESKQRMPAEMGELLAQLLSEMPVAIMSGASLHQIQTQFLPSLPAETQLERLYLFSTNAAQCYIYRDNAWKPQYDNTFTPAEKETILSALNTGLKEVGLDTEPAQIWGVRIEDRDAQFSFSPLGQQAPVDAKEAWRKEHNDKRQKLHHILSEKLPECTVTMGGITTIDITRKGISKAYGVERLSEFTHTPLSEMLYVGDALEEGGNDAVVLETGIPVHSVFGPEETAALITTIVHKVHY